MCLCSLGSHSIAVCLPRSLKFCSPPLEKENKVVNMGMEGAFPKLLLHYLLLGEKEETGSLVDLFAWACVLHSELQSCFGHEDVRKTRKVPALWASP